MYGHDTLFLYFNRRAQQEQIAAINANNSAAAAAHGTLSHLHAAKAAMAIVTEGSPDDLRVEADTAAVLLAVAA